MINVMTDARLRQDLVRAGEALLAGLSHESFADAVCARHEDWCGQLGWLEKNSHPMPRTAEQH